MSHQCFICKKIIDESEYFIVRQAIKPKRQPFRWKKIGYAHEKCGKEHKITFEFGEKIFI